MTKATNRNMVGLNRMVNCKSKNAMRRFQRRNKSAHARREIQILAQYDPYVPCQT